MSKLELIAETWIYSNNNFSKSYLQRNVKNLQRDDQLEQFKNLILTGLSGLSFPHSHFHRFIISFSHFGNVGDSYLRSCILRWISQAILKWNISYNSSVETGLIIFVKIWWNIELKHDGHHHLMATAEHSLTTSLVLDQEPIHQNIFLAPWKLKEEKKTFPKQSG